MRFLFVSEYGLITDVTWRVQQEGHEVRYYIGREAQRDIGDGFVPKVTTWEDSVGWADVVVFDDVQGHGTLAEGLRREGVAVVGGTAYTDRLEDDRTFGQEELKRAGVSIIPFESFTSFDSAIEYVQANPNRYVIKPSGEAQNIKRLLFVGEEADGADVVRILEAYRESWGERVKEFQLQRRVTGVEVAVGAFFNGVEFIEPINVNFEHKKLFPGNVGPATGEMGTLMFWSGLNRIFNMTVRKMESRLREESYVGYIDINCIVNANGIYPLEFTCRFGYPTIFIQQAAMRTPIGALLHGLATRQPIRLKVHRGYQVGVRIILPPYPFDDPVTFQTYSKDAAIVFRRSNSEGVHIEDVKCIDGQWRVAGQQGVALVVVGMGHTVRQAQAQAYNRISNIMIPNMYYRSDIGDRWLDDSDRLHAWGYLRDL